MSGRLLRKVLEEQEAQGQQEHIFDSGDEPDSPDSATHGSINPFNLLNDDDHDDDQMQGSDPDAAEPLKEDIDDKEPPLLKATILKAPSTNQKAKKKKKKKKNKEFPFSHPHGGEKPLDLKLENLSVEDKSSSSQSGSLIVRPANVEDGAERDVISILQVDAKFLSSENELRRIFGSKVVKSLQKSHQTGSSRQIRGGRHGSHNHRRTILVTPEDQWHHWDGSLTMELLETRNGCHYFKYVHLSSYNQAQRAFEAAKAINDHNGIASVLFHHPYHVDSLIALAYYSWLTGDLDTSGKLIAKCVYALECAWHPMFNPLQNNCRLTYSHESNRPFFEALVTHMKNIGRRGCHRAALEICKLLLSLDSNDYKGALQHIDYYSLRAEEYTWLEKFSEEYKRDNSLWLFPNFSYSLAVCRFYLEREASSKDSSETESGKATSADLLKQALMLHPPVLKKLVAKVPLKDQVWTNILKNRFFRQDQTGNPSLDHLIEIYIERSNIIWRLPDLQKLLRDSALQAIETLEHNKSEAQDWACVRKEAFPSEKNEYSHLLVSDFSDSMPTMPPELMQNLMVDPRMREVQNVDQLANPPNGARAPRDVANRNPLAVLFESMLPWVDYGRGGEVVEDGRQNDNGHVQDNEN